MNKNLEANNKTYLALNLGDENNESHRPESLLGVICANITEESAGLDVIRELVENKAIESEIQKAREDLGAKMYSEYQGQLPWDDANKKCKLLKMRLLTITELKEVYESEITKSWQKDGNYYWSSTPYDVERYYGLYVPSGDTGYGSRNGDGYVRCRL